MQENNDTKQIERLISEALTSARKVPPRERIEKLCDLQSALVTALAMASVQIALGDPVALSKIIRETHDMLDDEASRIFPLMRSLERDTP